MCLVSGSMAIDPRTPVLVGSGQVLHRADGVSDALEPAELMARAIEAAADDAGLAAPPEADSIRVVSSLSWRYQNPALVVAGRLGIEPRELAVTTMGGNSPQALVNTTAQQILAGELDVAILVGGEAWRTRMRARRDGVELDWPRAPDEQPPTTIGSEFTMNHQAELDRGIVQPVQVYPMFDTAIRAASGRSPAAHLELISEMWSRFSAVAAANPNAWSRRAMSAVDIRTPTPANRMVGFPYTKYMNSNNDVDMAAALIMCSAEAAGRLGVAADRWVFPHSGTDCHEHAFVSHRDTFARTPAIEIGGQRALALAGVGIDDVALIDLYSCFPSAVQLGAMSLGLDPYAADRQLTRTGGLAFAGGPWNNYVTHAIATVMTELPRSRRRVRLGVGQRRIRDEALVRCVLGGPTARWLPARVAASGDRRAPPSPVGGARRCRGPGNHRGVHGDALARGSSRARDQQLPARRRKACVGTVGRPPHRSRGLRG